MSAGLATRRILDRHARQQQRSERRGMELVAGLVVLALASVVGCVVVLLVGATADAMTGLGYVTETLRAAVEAAR